MGGDKRMCKKVNAIFAYIGLNIEVYRLEFNETETK